MHDPLTVQCPDCYAPAAVECRTNFPDETHAARRDAARMAAAELGRCDLCTRPMIRLTDPDDAYHPAGIADDCPPLPSPADWNAYAKATSGTGKSPGHPGPEHFSPVTEDPTTWPHLGLTDTRFTPTIGDEQP